MADFASLTENNQAVPGNFGTATDNALGLSNPDSVLSGTNRGTQNLGSRNIRSEPENTRIVVDDNTTNRVSFGKIGTGVNDWGLKVSQSGINVDLATPDQLIFNSSQNVFKIASIVPYTYTFTTTDAANNYANFTVSHNLGYAPTIEASFKNSTDNLKRPMPYNYRSPTSSYFATADNISASVEIYFVDTTTITVSIKVFDAIGLSWLLANSVLTFQFYCLQESIVT